MHETDAGSGAPIPAAQIDLGRSRDARGGRSQRAVLANWRIIAAFTLAIFTFTGSTLLAWSIADPMGPLGSWSPLAWVHDQRALHYLSKERPTATDISAAESESWAALNLAPVDDAAWLELALADRLRNGRLTPKGLLWLQRSYDVAPLGPDTSLWRIRFVLENWAALTPDLHKQAFDETRATWTHAAGQLVQMPAQVGDPAGHLAIVLMISQLRSQDAAQKKAL